MTSFNFSQIVNTLVSNKIKKPSATAYVNTFKFCLKTHSLPTTIEEFSNIDFAAAIREFAESQYPNIKSRKTNINSIAKVLKFIPEMPKDKVAVLEQYNEELRVQSEQIRNTNSEPLCTTWDEIVKVHDQVKEIFNGATKRTRLGFRRYLYLASIVQMPPMRGENLYNTFIGKPNSDETINYIDLDKGELKLYEFKNSASFGAVVHKIPNDLLDLIKLYKEQYDNTYWIDDENGEQLNAKSFNNFVARLGATYKIRLGSNIVRKAKITFASQNGEDMEELAKKSLHSKATQDKDYNKDEDRIKIIRKYKFKVVNGRYYSIDGAELQLLKHLQTIKKQLLNNTRGFDANNQFTFFKKFTEMEGVVLDYMLS